MKRILLLFASVALLASAMAQMDFAKELESMQKMYQADMQAFYKKAEDDAKNGVAFDMSKGPAKGYIPKAFDLARRASGSDTGAQALAFAAQLSYASQDKASFSKAIDALVEDYPSSPSLASSLPFVAYIGMPQADAIKMLSRIEDKVKDPEVKAKAVMLRVGFFYDDYNGTGDIPRAKGILNRLMETYPNTKAATSAKNTLFAMDNLTVGRPAPDFSVTDSEGVDFKLSDYRGKVVVVDFWGFW